MNPWKAIGIVLLNLTSLVAAVAAVVATFQHKLDWAAVFLGWAILNVLLTKK